MEESKQNETPESQSEAILRLQEELTQEKNKNQVYETRFNELEAIFSENNQRMKYVKVRSDVDAEKLNLQIAALQESNEGKERYVLILLHGDIRLPILIGTFEAQAIAISIEKMQPVKPLTHDLMKNIITALGFTLKEIIIDDIVDGIFISKIILVNNDNYIEVDTRTSDAIALAVKFNAPIYTYSKILDAAGIIPEEKPSFFVGLYDKIKRIISE